MVENPALQDFGERVQDLRRNKLLSPYIKAREVRFGALSIDDICQLMGDDTAYYFLLAAAGLNRTSLKKDASSETAKIVAPRLRKAFAVQGKLPVRALFDDIANKAVTLRRADINRRSKGAIESLFRERLKEEGIPVLMSPPVRQVPGILVGKRKPDGVYPDPATNEPPVLYLEIKNVRRVSDDIQKRLYEIAEASLEMKFLYGGLTLRGPGAVAPKDVIEARSEYRAQLREAILQARPAVIVLMLCSRVEAEKYREGAEAFVDRVFFQEEIDECLACLRDVVGLRAAVS